VQAAQEVQMARAADGAALLAKHPAPIAAEVLRRMAPDQAAAVLLSAPIAFSGSTLPTMDPVRTATILAWLDAPARAARIAVLPEPLATEIEAIAAFPPGTAGRRMDARVLLFSPDTVVSAALQRLRTAGDRRIADVVLADDTGHFVGVVRLQDLATAEPDATIASVKSKSTVTVGPMAFDDDVAELLSQHRLASLPVLDASGVVLGVIRYDALVDAAQEAAVESLQQMVGGSGDESALSSPWVGIKSRLPWLNINLVTAFLAASVVGVFESTIAQFSALAVLLPVVAGQSGNTGAQALAVTMRGLALREIRASHATRVLRKELLVGLLNGLAISVVTSLGVFLWSKNLGLVLIMFMAMTGSMVAASAAGAVIPVVLVKLGRDPAVASSIILTTVTDVVGFFSFLGLATLLSPMLESLRTST
jgi:magnesium transporter